MDQKLIFIHIPKNAGTSARHYFNQRFGKDAVGWLLVDLSLKDLKRPVPDGRLDKLSVIGGHFEFNIAKKLPGRKVYAAIYRDPVVRAVSLFRFVQRMPAHRLHNKVSDSLVESCRRLPGLRRGIENVQVRYLCPRKKDVNIESALEVLSSNPFYLTNAGNSMRLLEAITADFEAHMPNRGEYEIKNANTSWSVDDRLLSDRETVDYIRELTSKDQELYDILHKKLGETGIVTPASPLSL